ncbi:hypothetical protein [Henriciella sp.]|uniref:hypothetical protein n=1 Tax=Henriciella sp. TaxID=1968823 RepID=UPI00260A78BD|nr:hypothetical protein [Henriciella sp.]
MIRPDQTLQKLVSLKRQKAEQVFAQAKADVMAEEKRLARLLEALAALDETGAGYEDFALSMRFGHSDHLMKQADEVREALHQRRAKLEVAKQALRSAMHSEDQVSGG